MSIQELKDNKGVVIGRIVTNPGGIIEIKDPRGQILGRLYTRMDK